MNSLIRYTSVSVYNMFSYINSPTASCRRLGLEAATYEINDDSKYQNMLDPLGFVFALSLCIRLFKRATWCI